MIHHPSGSQCEKNGSGTSANTTQSGHGCHRLLGEEVAGNSLHVIYPTLKTKGYHGDERECCGRTISNGGWNSGQHEQCACQDYDLSCFVRGPSSRDEVTGDPTAQQTASVGSYKRQPGKHSDLFETEATHSVEIKRQPRNVKPPDRIRHEPREHNGPHLPILQQPAPTEAL